MANLKELIEYSKANPDSDIAVKTRRAIEGGAYDQEAADTGIDLSWAGRPKLKPVVPTKDVFSYASPLENIRKGQADQNIEVTKGLLKETMKRASSAGAQNAGPVGAAMRANAPEFSKGFDALDETLEPSNPAQVYGAGTEFAAEIMIPTSIVAPKVPEATSRLIQRSEQVIKPKPSPSKAIGEVLQKSKPVNVRDVAAFRNLDLDGVKTYRELFHKVDDSIKNLSSFVDDTLSKDTTRLKLSELTTKTTSGSGKVVERNFVQTALQHLKELYTSTADDIGAADIDDLLVKASDSGLTRNEVNQISRLYNVEFGKKAFGRTGEPLTSVNAQMYENIREGVKEVARAGITGDEAKEADRVIHSLYNVKDLVERSAKAVQKLQQKIAERGLVEKVGHAVAKYIDTLSGGSIRGFVGGLLPRGAGYKVMNALDLEERLAGNLKIIQKAIQSGTDAEIISAVQKLTNLPK